MFRPTIWMSIGAGRPKFRICVTMSAGTNEKVTPGKRRGSDIRRSWMYSAVGLWSFPSDTRMSASPGPIGADVLYDEVQPAVGQPDVVDDPGELARRNDFAQRVLDVVRENAPSPRCASRSARAGAA